LTSKVTGTGVLVTESIRRMEPAFIEAASTWALKFRIIGPEVDHPCRLLIDA